MCRRYVGRSIAEESASESPTLVGHDERMRTARATRRSLDDDFYDFQYLFNCECGRDAYHVRVRPEKIPEVRDGSVDPEMAPFLTIDELFEELELFYRQGDAPDRISFHVATGVPTKFIFEGANPIDGGRVVFDLSGIILDPFERIPLPEQLNALAQARARWAATGMRDYDFTFRTMCLCDDRPRQVSVRDGVVTQVLDHENQLLGPTGGDGVVPITSLFDLIDNVLVHAFSVDVQYDPETGFPRFIEVDYEQNAVDDEVNYQVSDLQPYSS